MLIILSIIFILSVIIFVSMLVYKRYFDFRKYVKIEVTPSANRNSNILLQKMTFFISNLKSVPTVFWDFNVIFEISNNDNVTIYSIIIPFDYYNDIYNIVSNNFWDFKLSNPIEINEENFMEQYEGFMVFKTDNQTPFIKEVNIGEEKIIENIKTIITSVKNGSFQILLDFSSKDTIYVKQEDMDNVRVGNSIVSNNINFVKDISVSFRFLSFTKNFSLTNIPSAIGGILNLWGKSNHITKIFKNGELTCDTAWLKNTTQDFFYTLFNTNLPRLKSFSPSDLMYFSSKEIATIFSFITGGNIKSLNYKLYDPVKVINKQKELLGKYDPSEFTKISLIDYPWYEWQYFQLHAEVLRRHTYIVWKTWTWKTTALKVFIKDDIEKNRGFAVFDPNGDLAKEILDFIPDSRKNDVIYIDPSNYLGRVNLSIFSFLRELKKYQSAYEELLFNSSQELDINKNTSYQNLRLEDKLMWMIVQIIKDVSVWGKEHWGARMDSIMKNVWSELLRYNSSEIIDLSSFLNNTDFRRNVIYNMIDQSTKEELLNFEAKDDKQREEAFQPVRNRFHIFLNETMRNIFSWIPEFSLKEMMDGEKILIFRLPKGTLGPSANLLGSIMVWLFWALAQTRITQPEKERKDFTLYIDEVQNFVTDSFSAILEEARKYRLRLVMANQFTKQIYDKNPQVYNSIWGNIWTFIALWIWQEDSQFLGKYFDINPLDMVNIPPLHWYVKCPSYTDETFNIEMEFIQQNPEYKYPWALHLMNLSHSKYWLKTSLKSVPKKFSMPREVVNTYLLRVKQFDIKTFTFDLSITTKEATILLDYLTIWWLVRITEDNTKKYETIDEKIFEDNALLQTLEEEQLYFEFDYDDNYVQENDVSSLRTYFSFFEELPSTNLIKESMNFAISRKKNTKSDKTQMVFQADGDWEERPRKSSKKTDFQLSKEIDIPNDFELPKEDWILGRKLMEQNEWKQDEQSPIELDFSNDTDISEEEFSLDDEFTLDVDDLVDNSSKTSDTKENKGDFENYESKYSNIIDFARKNSNLTLFDSFAVYLIAQEDVGVSWEALGEKLGFINPQEFIKKIRVTTNIKTDFNLIITNSHKWKKLLYTI